jgi:ABC-2 type transport system permease protein
VSPRRIGAIARRIAQQFRHDPRTLALLFVVPIFIIALLAWILGAQQTTEVRVVVVDPTPGGRIAAALATAGTGNGITSVVIAASAEDAEALLRDDGADVALIVPADLGGAASGGASGAAAPTFIVMTPGISPGTDGTAVVAVQRSIGAALASVLPRSASFPTVIHATVYGSPGATTLDTFAPVFIGFFAYFFVFLLTGVSFLRERLGGTLERLLATPVTRPEIVSGYSLGFGAFASLQVAVLLAFVILQVQIPSIGPLPAFAIGLGVPSAGSPLLAYAVALLLALGAVNLGIFLSTFARTELQVIQFIPLVIVPQGLLGGIFWPVEQLPPFLQVVARLMPVTYAIEGLRAVMIVGADLTSRVLQIDVAFLAGVAILLVALATRTIRRQVV